MLTPQNCSFFGKVAAFKDLKDYVPNEEDILRVRKRTTGVVETTFTIAELTFRYVPRQNLTCGLRFLIGWLTWVDKETKGENG